MKNTLGPVYSQIPLLYHINQLVELDNDSAEIILNNCKEVIIPKGQIIFNDGVGYLYFIISGKARSYYADVSGKTITWSFHFNERQSETKNLFIFDYKNILIPNSGNMHIETLSDVQAIKISHLQIKSTLEYFYIIENCLHQLREIAIINAYHRVLSLYTLSASERYKYVLYKEPHLLQLFPDKYLASYIGVEPQSLSRIRKNLKLSEYLASRTSTQRSTSTG